MAKKTLFFNDSTFRFGREAENGGISNETRGKVRKGVVAAHVSLLLIPLLWYLVSSLFTKPRPQVIKVSLVSLPATTRRSPPPSAATARPTHSPPSKRRRPRVPPKPKWRPKKANQIKVSRKVVRANSAPSRKRRTPSVKYPTASELEKRLRSAAAGSVVATSSRNQTSRSKSATSPAYSKKLYAAIYALWRQPSKAELNGLCPTADISLTIDASGRVLNPRISRKSGVPAMDASVRRLLRELRALPPPPSGTASFTISLEIVE